MTKRHIIPKRKLRPHTLDIELFLRLLTSSVESIPPISNSPPPADLDNYAENITRAIQKLTLGLHYAPLVITKATLGGMSPADSPAHSTKTSPDPLSTQKSSKMQRKTIAE